VTQIAISRTAQPKQPPADESLAFGKVFTDHMFLMNYDEGKGWHSPRIEPYAPFTLDPAACVLHYGQAIFDGLKAFRGADGQIRLFRLPDHARRINTSAHYLCIPELDPELVEESIRALVEVDQRWVPSLPGTSLYIRPTIIATETFLGVHPSHSYLYYVIVGPVGAYYKEGMNPVRILATEKYTRAVKGGLGAAKTAGNYAASLFGAREAEQAGYTQVLWLDGVEHKYLDEVGTMNIMLKIGDEVLTPPLNGAILDGITRRSSIQLLRDWGYTVTERPISIDEVTAAAQSGRLEMWGTGTAAVISPVGELGYKGERYLINNGQTGALTQRLYDTIVGIQYGKTADPYGWVRTLGNRLGG
jgi:branched-chain amino acid aminotransferase